MKSSGDIADAAELLKDVKTKIKSESEKLQNLLERNQLDDFKVSAARFVYLQKVRYHTLDFILFNALPIF